MPRHVKAMSAHPLASCSPPALLLEAVDRASSLIRTPVGRQNGLGRSQAITSLGILRKGNDVLCKNSTGIIDESQEDAGCSALSSLMPPGTLAPLVPQLLTLIFASASSHEQGPVSFTSTSEYTSPPALQEPRFLVCLHPLTRAARLSLPHPDGLPAPVSGVSAALLPQPEPTVH